MSSNTTLGRHRAEVVRTSPISVIAKAVSSNVGGVGRQAAVIAAASGLVLTSGIAANAATPTVERASDGGTMLSQKTELASAVTAASTVTISFATPVVSSTPAPVVEEPVVAAKSNEVVAAPAAKAAAPKITTVDAPAAAPAIQSGVGATIAAAAYAQLGVAQDCTALATNSLAAAGINYHGWPAGYLSLGRTVSQAEAQPGDLIYYADGGMGMAHIAVYVGGGQAVHGGWGGGTTALFSVNVGSGPVFIAIGH
ncbi:NlpC/P60 family protein [Arthrobacter sp. GMC3]|uniref:NlpC/P60 family protein n=1 Tax=Arthrobacter sp. GMC3 TaxID=2058894 RepID=UPI000CE475B1|nr:NlpC/P60 family protein [Arthrobacter sp. GMC3]